MFILICSLHRISHLTPTSSCPLTHSCCLKHVPSLLTSVSDPLVPYSRPYTCLNIMHSATCFPFRCSAGTLYRFATSLPICRISGWFLHKTLYSSDYPVLCCTRGQEEVLQPIPSKVIITLSRHSHSYSSSLRTPTCMPRVRRCNNCYYYSPVSTVVWLLT